MARAGCGSRGWRSAWGCAARATRREVERLIRRAFDGGINLFDCANVYGLMDDRAYAGRSEEILGRALRGRARRRRHHLEGLRRRSARGRTTRAPRATTSCARSSARCGGWRPTGSTSTCCTASMPATPLDEQFRALDDLVRQGKVRYVGVCNYQAWQVCRALWVQDRIEAAPLITVQNPYSLLNRALEGEMFPLVRALGVGVMCLRAAGDRSAQRRLPARPAAAGGVALGRAPGRAARGGAGRAAGRGAGGRARGRRADRARLSRRSRSSG